MSEEKIKPALTLDAEVVAKKAEDSVDVFEKVVEISEDVKANIEKKECKDEVKKAEVKEEDSSQDSSPMAKEYDDDPFMNEEELKNLSSLSLKDIVLIFQSLLKRHDQQEMYKYADHIKASFYKALKREKIAIGFQTPSDDISLQNENKETEAEFKENEASKDPENLISRNPFAEIERGFKELYQEYKRERSKYIQNLEAQKEKNLEIRLQIIQELKTLTETQEDLNRTFPEFRKLQARWRESGPIPQNRMKDVHETYFHYVEMFYDYVKINNELRDLDFKKNLEAKTDLCVKAEALVEASNIVSAFNDLQKLHEQWKEIGPVSKEMREPIWERFKAATSTINRKHQMYFENIKQSQRDNLTAKTTLCEKAEVIANKDIKDSSEWNKQSKEFEKLQKEWKGIGFATKKENQRIYDRFRTACDKFYSRKREYYAQFKVLMAENMEKKIALCEQAEALKDSTDWKKTTDQLIALQKEWKKVGPVSRKKSEIIWTRFRAACDEFFNNKDKNYGGVDPKYVENLQAKQAIIEEVKAYQIGEDKNTIMSDLKDFTSRFNVIGFVPFKEKDKVLADFKAAISEAFGDYAQYANYKGGRSSSRGGFKARGNHGGIHTEKDRLIQKFHKKENDIQTYENNIGFFASSKTANKIVAELEDKIAKAKAELKELEEKIKSLD